MSTNGTSGDAPVLVFKPLPAGAKKTLRRRRDKGKLKGLPDERHIHDLARTYLVEQAKHWPELRSRGLLPAPDDGAALQAMVDVFKTRHATLVVPMPSVELTAAVKELAGAYSRYSDENSKPTSIADQLARELAKAKEHQRFVPWAWVFADYAITGLDRERTDYACAKLLMSLETPRCNVLYIDDFTRASRDEIEWWKLAALLKRNRRNLIGASDGFDLSHPHSEIMITIYGLLSRLFMKSLSEKVRRGIRGAASRETSTGKPAFGYALVPATDAHGNAVVGADGEPLMTEAIDPDLAEWVLKVFRDYADELLTADQIARRFNKHSVGGCDWWAGGTILKLIRNPKYIGIAVGNKTRRYRDPETNKIIVEELPRREWTVQRRPSLRIVPTELWKRANRRARQRKAENPRTGKPWRKRAVMTLLSGILACDECLAELLLSHSSQSFKSFYCPNGSKHLSGCTMDSHKTLKAIEETLIGYVMDHLLSDAVIDQLVTDANAALALAQAAEPDDLRPLRTALKSVTSKAEKLSNLIADDPSSPSAKPLRKKLDELEIERSELAQRILEAERRRKKISVAPIDRETVLEYLQDVRALLYAASSGGDKTLIPRAAELLRRLLGTVRISHRQRPGTKRRDWFARFTPQTRAILPPGTFSDGVVLPEVELPLDPAPKAVRVAPTVKAFVDRVVAAGGSEPSALMISSALRLSYALTQSALAYLKTGVVKRLPAKPRAHKPRAVANAEPQDPKYKRLAPEVAKLVDQERLTLKKAATALGINESTALRAYRYQKQPAQSLLDGRYVRRGRHHKLNESQKAQVRQLLATGASADVLAQKFAVGRNTIRRCLTPTVV